MLPQLLQVRVRHEKADIESLSNQRRARIKHVLDASIECSIEGVSRHLPLRTRECFTAAPHMQCTYLTILTSAGFRRITTNCSARCIKKLVNLWQRIVSISSACFTAILTRTLLTLVSMRHFSCSLRQIVTGLSRSSLLDLRWNTYAREDSSLSRPDKNPTRGVAREWFLLTLLRFNRPVNTEHNTTYNN